MFDALSLGKLGCEVLGQRQILILSGRAIGIAVKAFWGGAAADPALLRSSWR